MEHGAPLRLGALVKLGLKNIEAIARITYTKDEVSGGHVYLTRRRRVWEKFSNANCEKPNRFGYMIRTAKSSARFDRSRSWAMTFDC